MKLKFVCMSHIGRVRRTNQDNYVVPNHACAEMFHDITEPIVNNSDDCGAVFAVFDGIGGLAKGEAASAVAANSMRQYVGGRKFQKDDYPELCRVMNGDVCRYMRRNKISSMGTTFSSLLFCGGEVTACNIGDSPMFLMNGTMKKISVDHTGGGSIKPALTQYIGVPTEEFVIEPYVQSFKVRSGDRFLICSDGLTDMVSGIDIMDILGEGDIKATAEALTKAALEGGGKDNVTLILIDAI